MNTEIKTQNPEIIREWASIPLGALVGALAALPLSVSEGKFAGPTLIILFAAAGALVSYRKRKSIMFFYFSLFVALTLSCIAVFAS